MRLLYSALAHLTVLGHLAFVVFVVLGGLLALRWPRVAWVHLPCAAWGALVEIAGWICPLTPLEQVFRERAGEGTYGTSFLEHYVVPLLYPGALTRAVQIGLGVAVVALNAAVYWVVWRRAGRA
jgi:hypothetical protein